MQALLKLAQFVLCVVLLGFAFRGGYQGDFLDGWSFQERFATLA